MRVPRAAACRPSKIRRMHPDLARPPPMRRRARPRWFAGQIRRNCPASPRPRRGDGRSDERQRRSRRSVAEDPEKAFVRDAIDRRVPMLGVCLGAQLIASALGARVYANPVKEIGWFPVRAVGPAADDAFSFPTSPRVSLARRDVRLATGAVQLAESDGCRAQAFQVGRMSSACSSTWRSRRPARVC